MFMLTFVADNSSRYNPLHRQSFYDDIFTPLYDLSQTKPVTSHALSVAFGVLALGALVDIDREPYDPEAEKFHYLARAALAVESCLENTTINAVQALVSYLPPSIFRHLFSLFADSDGVFQSNDRQQKWSRSYLVHERTRNEARAKRERAGAASLDH